MQSTTRIFTFALLTLTACGPCESSIVADTFAGPVVCPDSQGSGDTGGSSTEGSGSSTDGVSETGMTPTASGSESETDGAECQTDAPPIVPCPDGQVCNNRTNMCETIDCAPAPGDDWGPCVDNKCPASQSGAMCLNGPGGNLCAPGCPGTCPDSVHACGGDVCVVGALCIPECATAADCPDASMLCEFVGGLAFCAWPK